MLSLGSSWQVAAGQGEGLLSSALPSRNSHGGERREYVRYTHSTLMTFSSKTVLLSSTFIWLNFLVSADQTEHVFGPS